ncbi:putative DNA-binding ribbon-helix-helix protein [Azospirillum fermentarium]|uniref:ribbon-helix-helix domain-containing protein n=1 Tax=Azospirillum fermentarium TaxID=1233114 RepID=UPI00222601F3|nr:ribbon-helix-helix domain-containing protein [Azospirillum fermentarium]MCW2248423.1 putative DNA-binding ribbon-helix-helix protein [Azospirillum fermentarium]
MNANPPSLIPLPTDMVARGMPLHGGAEAVVTLEHFYWEALGAIAGNEGMTIDALVRETDRRRVLLPEAMALEPALRLFCVCYYQQATVLSGDPVGETIGQLMDKAIHFRR